MEIYEAINGRRSIRRFRPDPVPSEVLERLVHAAHLAPFGTRGDERHFVVLGGEAKVGLVDFLRGRIDELLPALQEASPSQVMNLARSVLPVLESAPVVIAVWAELTEGGSLLSLPSAAGAVENLMLAAHSEGLGTCWVTGATYLADDLAEFLGVERMRLVCLIPLGYLDHEPALAPTRRAHLYWRGFADRADTPLPALTLPVVGGQSVPPDQSALVLLVEHTPTVLASLAETLEQAGHRVLRCPNAEEAETIAREQHPDMVIADALLPGKTGYQLCAELHALDTGYVPVLLTTTSYTSADEIYALERGADALLQKPFGRHTLLAHVASLLRIKRLYDQVERQKRELATGNEELRRLQEAQESLTHLIVHDLRTPLTSILGALRLVTENDYEAVLTGEMVPMALSAAQTLLRMVNDLLDVAKLENGQVDLDLTDFPLERVFRQVHDLTAGTAQERGLELVFEPPIDLAIHGDEDFTGRLLTNLVGNSLKFTHEGAVRVWAEAQPDQDRVALHVRDTGVGIPPEAQARVFEKFGQMERPPGQPRMGTGLGLAFVKMAAEAMGGDVSLESEVGQGSTFTVRLPQAAPPPGDAPPEPKGD